MNIKQLPKLSLAILLSGLLSANILYSQEKKTAETSDDLELMELMPKKKPAKKPEQKIVAPAKPAQAVKKTMPAKPQNAKTVKLPVKKPIAKKINTADIKLMQNLEDKSVTQAKKDAQELLKNKAPMPMMAPPPPPPPPPPAIFADSSPSVDLRPSPPVGEHDHENYKKIKVYSSNDYIFSKFGFSHISPHNAVASVNGKKYSFSYDQGYGVNFTLGYNFDNIKLGFEGVYENYKLRANSINHGNGSLQDSTFYSNGLVQIFRFGPTAGITSFKTDGGFSHEISIGAGMGYEQQSENSFFRTDNTKGITQANSEIFPYAKIETGLNYENDGLMAGFSYGLSYDAKTQIIDNIKVKAPSLTSNIGFKSAMRF